MGNYADEARDAAAQVLAEMPDVIPAALQPLIRTALSIAYLEGSKAGAEQAVETFRAAMTA